MGSVVLFSLVLFVMGGVTAYMGDKLGSYIGKKRHSSFGLRPRHTAMLWTVVSGGAIAVGTLALLFVLDNTVRTALLQGRELVQQKAMLEHQNAALTRRNAATEQQAQTDGLRAVQAQKNADGAQKRLVSVFGELGQAKTKLGQSQATLQQRQAALAAAQTQLGTVRTGLGHTQAELAGAEARVREARRGVLEARQQYQIARSQAAQAGKEVLQANRSLLALGIQQDRLHAENARLISRNQVQQSLLQTSLGHAVIFRRGEELGRTVISSRQAPDALRRELAVFLDQIELAARQHGAGSLDNSPAVLLPAPVTGEAGGPAEREAALDALSQNIAEQSGFMPSIVVVADAHDNTFRGETVTLNLRPYSNVLVFSKGMVIADSPMDGTQSDAVILTRLQAFLTGRVRTIALRRGIIPLLDPESGESLVGQPIESDKWLALVKQIHEIGPDARVTAAASEDTFSGDLLHLDLQAAPK